MEASSVPVRGPLAPADRRSPVRNGRQAAGRGRGKQTDGPSSGRTDVAKTTSAMSKRRARSHVERLADEQYDRVRTDVLGGVTGRLFRKRVDPAPLDIEDRYQDAWADLVEHGGSEEIKDLSAFIAVLTYNGAISESRRPDNRRRVAASLDELLAEIERHRPGLPGNRQGLAKELERSNGEPWIDADDGDQATERRALNQWRTSVRLRLTRREQQAIVRCHLLDYSRADAARELGISEKRLDKVIGEANEKLAGELSAIENGEWCEQHQSLMRAFALGVLRGERRELAAQHARECAGCASVVRSLRGLLAIGPPAPVVIGAAGKGGLLGGLLELVRGPGAAGGGAVAAGGGGVSIVGGLGAKVAAVCAAGACAVAVPATVELPGDKPAPAKRERSAQRSAPANPARAVATSPIPATPVVHRELRPTASTTRARAGARKPKRERDSRHQQRDPNRASTSDAPAPASDDFVGGAPVASKPARSASRSAPATRSGTSNPASATTGASDAGSNTGGDTAVPDPAPAITPAPDADVVIVP